MQKMNQDKKIPMNKMFKYTFDDAVQLLLFLGGITTSRF